MDIVLSNPASNQQSYVYFIVNDALDDILADSDDESEEQAVIDKVLDEIGIEISGKVNIFVILKDRIRIISHELYDWHRYMGLI